MLRMSNHGLLVFGLLTALSMNGAAGSIDTTGAWDGVAGTSTFGEGATTTYGQTFRAPTGMPVLESFSFFLDDREELPELIEFAAYVMEWSAGATLLSPSMATGPVMYESGSRTTTNNGGADGMEQISFSTSGLLLDPAKQYVAFLDVTNYLDGVNDGIIMGTLPLGFDAYSYGYFTIVNAPGNDFSLLTMTGWSVFDGFRSSHQDAAFIASFSAVPVPPAVRLFGSAITALVCRRRVS